MASPAGPVMKSCYDCAINDDDICAKCLEAESRTYFQWKDGRLAAHEKLKRFVDLLACGLIETAQGRYSTTDVTVVRNAQALSLETEAIQCL